MRKILLFTLLIFLSSCIKKQPVHIKTTYISDPIQNRKVAENIHDQDCKGFVNQYFPHKSLNISDFNNIKILKKKTGLNWQKIVKFDPYLNFKSHFDSCDNKVAHVVDIIDSPKDKKNIVSIGSDDGFSLWVNGDSITTVHKGRGVQPGDDIVQINLKKGKNIVLFKVDNSVGGWALHRKYTYTAEELVDLKNKLYSDVLESCIYQDTSNYLPIKERRLIQQKTLLEFTNLDSISFSWYDMQDVNFTAPVSILKYQELPRTITIPSTDSKGYILKVTRYNEEKILYEEYLPVLSDSLCRTLAEEMYSQELTIKDPNYLARKDAVGIAFHLKKLEWNREYSTRMKCQILYDLFLTLNFPEKYWKSFPGPKIMGYLSKADSSIQMYRVYIPNQQMRGKRSLLFKISHKRSNTDDYLRAMGASHSYMANWTRLCNLYNTIIVQPYGRGEMNYQDIAKEEIPIIYNQICDLWTIDTNRVSFWGGSNGTRLTFDMMCRMDFNIYSFCGMCIVPGHDLNNWDIILKYMKREYPNIKFFIRHGLDDELSPVEGVRKWTKIVKRNKIQMNYDEIPNTGHHLDYNVTLEEYLKWICDQ